MAYGRVAEVAADSIEEHQRTAAKMAEAWDLAIDAAEKAARGKVLAADAIAALKGPPA